MKRYCLLILSLTLLTSSVQVSAETMEDAMNAARMRDYATMASILKKLANEGDKDAQYQLAKLYRNGLGVDKDLQKAGVWANKSAQQGVKKAIELRDTLCRKTSDCELPVELKDIATGTAEANTHVKNNYERQHGATIQAAHSLLSSLVFLLMPPTKMAERHYWMP
jgi:TPR repeat protein